MAFIGVLLTIELQPLPTDTAMAMGGVRFGTGELFAALAAIASTMATLLSKRRLSMVPLSIFNVVRTGLGAIVFFWAALGLYGPSHFMELSSPFLWQIMLVYGTIVVVVGQSAWSAGLQTTSVATASTIGSFTPIFGIAAAFLILGEVPTHAQSIGGGAILLGLFLSWLGMKGGKKKRDRVDGAAAERSIECQVGYKGM